MAHGDDGDGKNDQARMLADAIAKARKLVSEFERQQRELAASPPPHDQQLPPEQLAEGKRAFDNALAAARRMLESLEDAAALPAD